MKLNEEINNQLKLVYEPYLSGLKTLSAQQVENFSYPLLMSAFEDYTIAKRKVLYVGKETYGWVDTMNNSKDLTVDFLTNKYIEFEFAKNYSGKNSPFWRFIRILHDRLNGENSINGFLWTNFSKFDNNGTTPDQNLQKLNNKGFDLLVEEIKITSPEIVIFITGWDYEQQFQRVFLGLKYKTIEENYLYQCIHAALPKHTYMTMHPKGLQLRKKFNSTIQSILECLKVD